ncbi:hypothetical protein, conserved [Leishmania lindenbergi]|uniref:5'a2rel-related protein n=1 Tax=Leishmania lindenbergi TaxID=651832 RepID=A0AAW2ZQU6_9TRYP
MRGPFCEPAREIARAADTLAPTQGRDTRRGSTGFIRKIRFSEPNAMHDSRRVSTMTTSSGDAAPLSVEARVAAVRQRRLAREARAFGAAVVAVSASAKPTSLPHRLTERERNNVTPPCQPHTVPSLPLQPIPLASMFTMTSPPETSPLAVKSSVAQFALESSSAKGVSKVVEAVGVDTRRSPRTASYAASSTETSDRTTYYSSGSSSAATTERPAQDGRIAALHRFPSSTSSAFTAAFSESVSSKHSFTVVSVCDSSPSNPIRHAAMNAKSDSTQRARGQCAEAEMPSPPYRLIDDTQTARRLFSTDTESSTYVTPRDTVVDTIRITNPENNKGRHFFPTFSVQRQLMATVEEDCGRCTSIASTPETIASPSLMKMQTVSPKKTISSTGPSTSSRGIDKRTDIDASHLCSTDVVSLSRAVPSIRSFAPFSRSSTTRSQGSCASPQPLSEDESWPISRDSIEAGVCLRRDSPHTRRAQSASREGSLSGRVTSALSALPPGNRNGRLRSASAGRDTTFRAAFSAKMPSFSSFGHRMAPTVANRAAPLSCHTRTSSLLLSSAIYPVFLATTTRSRYNLLDDTTTTSATESAERDIITEELAMQRRLSRLKLELARQRVEWRRRGGHTSSL